VDNVKTMAKRLPRAVRLLAVVAALILPARVTLATGAAFVGNIGASTNTTSTNSSIAITVGASGVMAGDSIIVGFASSTRAGAVGCFDTKGNSYSVDADQINGGAGRVSICSAHNVTALASDDKITATYPGFSGITSATATEFAGLLPIGAFDTNSIATGNTAFPSSGPTATSQPDELLYGAIFFSGTNSATFTPGAGYTRTNPDLTGRPLASEYRIVPLGTYQADGVLTTANQWAAGIATYRFAGSCALPAGSTGTVARSGSECVLASDVVLSMPFSLDSFTHLNCQGHTISATSTGFGIPSADPKKTDTSSNPEVGLVLDGAYGVAIQNCVIDGFDFGIYALSSKVPSEVQGDPAALSLLSTTILDNTINARYAAVGLSKTDNVEIKSNEMNLGAPGTAGVLISRDSDVNRVIGNHIQRTVSGPPKARRQAPGRKLLEFPTNALGVNALNRRSMTVQNIVIAGKLTQNPYDPAEYDENNVIQDNVIDLNRGTATASIVGIATSEGAQGTIVRGNTVINAAIGLQVQRAGSESTPNGFLPGACVGGTADGRACGDAKDSTDCFFEEAGDTVAGVCLGVHETTAENRPRDILLEDNVVSNAVNGIMAQAVIGLTLTGNRVNASTNGMNLGGGALDNGTLVTRNILSNDGNGLFLTDPVAANQGPSPTSFGAEVMLNDITGSTARAIGRSTGPSLYSLSPTELSAMRRGNYWGRPCSDSEGFREFGQAGADSPAAFIVDSHPYGQSVANTLDGLLPPSCRP
jgi:Periplasmic copper-binding protein (NosD)